MTEKEIKENFAGLSDFIDDEDTLNWYYSLVDTSVTETAKGFAEWVDDNYYRLENNNWSDYKTVQEEYTTEQLYEIYKNKQQ